MKDQKIKIWDGYGTGFWHVMTFLSALLILLGVITLGFSLARIIWTADRWIMWFILAGAGIASITAGVFCMGLFPSWGSIVRRIRLAEERMSGAMSIAQINKYEERENKRNTEIKEQLSESVGKVGRDMVDTKARVANVEQRLEAIPDSVAQLVEEVISRSSNDRELKKRIITMSGDLENVMNSRITAVTREMENMEQKLSNQYDELIRQIAASAVIRNDIPMTRDEKKAEDEVKAAEAAEKAAETIEEPADLEKPAKESTKTAKKTEKPAESVEEKTEKEKAAEKPAKKTRKRATKKPVVEEKTENDDEDDITDLITKKGAKLSDESIAPSKEEEKEKDPSIPNFDDNGNDDDDEDFGDEDFGDDDSGNGLVESGDDAVEDGTPDFDTSEESAPISPYI